MIEEIAKEVDRAIAILENIGVSERSIEKIESAIKNDSRQMASAISYRYAIRVQ